METFLFLTDQYHLVFKYGQSPILWKTSWDFPFCCFPGWFYITFYTTLQRDGEHQPICLLKAFTFLAPENSSEDVVGELGEFAGGSGVASAGGYAANAVGVARKNKKNCTIKFHFWKHIEIYTTIQEMRKIFQDHFGITILLLNRLWLLWFRTKFGSSPWMVLGNRSRDHNLATSRGLLTQLSDSGNASYAWPVLHGTGWVGRFFRMLIPMNPDGSPGLVPEVVKIFHVYGWYVVIFLLSLQALGEILSGDAFAGIIFAIMAGIVVYMIHDGCKNMTMYCLFMLGIMSAFQCFFDILGLLSVLGGRETSSSTVSGTDRDVTVVTKITMHPFFDKSMDDQYNLQSLMMLLSPVIMSVSCCMCHLEKDWDTWTWLSQVPKSPSFWVWDFVSGHLISIFAILATFSAGVSTFWGYLSYNAFSDSLFELDDEADPIYSRGFAAGLGLWESFAARHLMPTGQPPSYTGSSSPRSDPSMRGNRVILSWFWSLLRFFLVSIVSIANATGTQKSARRTPPTRAFEVQSTQCLRDRCQSTNLCELRSMIVQCIDQRSIIINIVIVYQYVHCYRVLYTTCTVSHWILAPQKRWTTPGCWTSAIWLRAGPAKILAKVAVKKMKFAVCFCFWLSVQSQNDIPKYGSFR